MGCEWVKFSDTHLGKLKKLFPENHLELTMREFRKPFDYAVANGIKHVVSGGDLFDTPNPDYRYIRAVINVLRDYKDILKFWGILGNHEIEDADNNAYHLIMLCAELGILPHVRIFKEKEVVKIDGVPFNFMPYPHVRLSKKRVVNIAHIEPTGAKRDNNMLIRHGVEVDNQGSLNYIGHIHLQQQIGKNTWLCGGLTQTTFGETGPKGWYHSETRLKDDKFKNRVKFVKNDCSFELINLQIEVKDDFAKIEADPLKLYKLHLADGIMVPPKLTLKKPNVVQVVGFKGGEELSLFNKDLPVEMYEGSDVLGDLVDDPIWGLLEFLKKEGLDKRQRKRALKMVEEWLAKNPR